MAKAKAKEVEVVPADQQVVPAKGTALAVPEEIRKQLAQETQELAKRIQSAGGDMIKLTKDKHFKLPDGTKHPGPLTVVILDFVSVNQFFDRPYKEGEVTPPACYAIGLEPSSLVPSKNSPARQAEACNTCPNNQFGSKGDGKACGNHRMLVVRAGVGDDALDPNAPKFLLKVSPTGIKAFDSYVSTIRTQFGAPPIAVVTDIYFDKEKEYQSLRFGNPQPNPNLELHFSERAAARDRLLQEPDVSQYQPPKKKGK